MELELINGEYSVCKAMDGCYIDISHPFTFIMNTDEELSFVCETSRVPLRVTAAEHGFKALRLKGVLDFGLVGIIAKISEVLAKANVGIFVISTYNTDYILLKNEQYERGLQALTLHGYTIYT